MKSSLLRPILVSVATLALVTGVFAQSPAPALVLPDASPLAILKQRVGVTDIEVTYSRPSLKGRTALGGLLAPYGMVWRTGANNATRITFSTPATIQGSAIAAGTYELFTIPNQDEWTVIFQKPAKQWGSYKYDQANDVLRVTAKPTALPALVETFTIEFSEFRDDSAVLTLTWEKTRVPLKVQVDTVGAVVPQIKAAMAAEGGKKPYVAAAMFYLDNNIDLPQALKWMDAALADNPNSFSSLYRKAKVLAKMGDKAAAVATAKLSIAAAAKSSGEAKEEYTRLNNELIAHLN